MTGQGTCQCGDVNLTAALMSCGIPLDAVSPIVIIESEDAGKDYGSWRLAVTSEDGMEDTKSLMSFWNGGEIRDDHPLVEISSFIRGRPIGRLSVSEWLDYAMDWLKEQGHQVPQIKSIDDIPLFTKALPDDVRSYILAFVFNRATCLRLYSNAKRSVHKSRDDRHVMIDRKLPRHQKSELLSRFEG